MSLNISILKKEQIDEVMALIDDCVGKNLYRQEDILECVTRSDKWFYVITDSAGKIVGYIYFMIDTIDKLSSYIHEPIDFVSERIDAEKKLGRIQSVGVMDIYRSHGLSNTLIDNALRVFRENQVANATITCWKIGEDIPLLNTLEHFDFEYLCDAHNVWYDNDKLICPYCVGRCRCEAAVYYIRL